MKVYGIFLVLLNIVICGCSDPSAESARSIDTDAVMQQHEEITTRSVLADFVASISEDKYDHAFALLHPGVSEGWTLSRFTQDWKNIKSQLPSGWEPTATESFSGRSPQGPYEQAVYRLEADPLTSTSLELVSMPVEGKTIVVKVHVRMPESGTTPESVSTHANAFISAMQQEDYVAAKMLFAESTRAQYTPAILERIRPLLGDSQESTIPSHYRLCANSVWYDAVRLKQPGHPAAHLELIMQSGKLKTEIVSLTFKGRM